MCSFSRLRDFGKSFKPIFHQKQRFLRHVGYPTPGKNRKQYEIDKTIILVHSGRQCTYTYIFVREITKLWE